MINSKSKTKNVLVIRGSRTLGDPLLLFGEGMEILSSNSDEDGDIRKISGMGMGRLVPSPPLPIAIPNSIKGLRTNNDCDFLARVSSLIN